MTTPLRKRQYDPETKRAWNRAHEERAAAKGQRMVTVRLNPAAGRALDAICHEFGCFPRDVIERLLLGAAYEPSTPIPPHRLSESEADAARALGVAL
jgi:hypothetical protein